MFFPRRSNMTSPLCHQQNEEFPLNRHAIYEEARGRGQKCASKTPSVDRQMWYRGRRRVLGCKRERGLTPERPGARQQQQLETLVVRPEREVSKRPRLVAEGLEGLRRLLVDLGVLLGVGDLALSDLLALVVSGTLGLAALLKSVAVLVERSIENWCRRETHLATTSWYFQPTSWERRPTVQNLRPGCNLRTRRAWGTTIFFCLS